MRQWGGHSLAYSTLQPGLHYFGSYCRGFVAYARYAGCFLVLGDPIAALEDHAALLKAFDAYAGRRAIYCQIGSAVRETLVSFGMRSAPLGVESSIHLASFSLAGKQKADLRHYRNVAERVGLSAREEADTRSLREELWTHSRRWLSVPRGIARHEFSFLSRPLSASPEPDVRIFTVRRNGVLEGFVALDPSYDARRVCGYVACIARRARGAPEGALDYANLSAIDVLRDEGVRWFHLGISPFHRLEALRAQHGVEAPLVYQHFRMLQRFGKPIYNFGGLAFHKSRYRGVERPVFLAWRGQLPALRLFATGRVCRMF